MLEVHGFRQSQGLKRTYLSVRWERWPAGATRGISLIGVRGGLVDEWRWDGRLE